ncbi:MAG: DUF86 domain-containing protein [Desulfurococcales archaeon]|nr:DUF86 domain-containing protein [Desulfurococcales archaeon]
MAVGIRDLVGRLRGVASRHPEVVFLAVVRSVARRGFSAHDIDVAVKLSGGRKYDVLARLAAEISRELGVPDDRVDIIDLDRADPEIKAEVARSPIIVVDRGYYGELVREVERVFREYGEYRELSLREWLGSRDPTSIDALVVKRRLDFVRSEAGFLREHVLSKSAGEVKASPLLSRVLERSYQLIVEALVDVARHIVSSMGWGPCFTAQEYVEKLAERGVIHRELADEIARRVRIRNIIIQRYLDVDHEHLYRDAAKLIELAAEFERHVVDFIRRQARGAH